MEYQAKLEDKISMIATASRVLSFHKKFPLAIPEEVFQDVSDFIKYSKNNEEPTKLLMVASASRTMKLIKENPRLNHRKILSQVMEELDSIIQEAKTENNEMIS